MDGTEPKDVIETFVTFGGEQNGRAEVQYVVRQVYQDVKFALEGQQTWAELCSEVENIIDGVTKIILEKCQNELAVQPITSHSP